MDTKTSVAVGSLQDGRDALKNNNEKELLLMNELQLRVGPYRTTFVGTEITRESTKDEWTSYGEILKRVDEAKQWAIGDWLCDGKKHYGDGLYEAAEKISGQSAASLRVYKHMSARFELLTRVNNLTWKHHYEVASIREIETDENGKMSWSKNWDKEKAIRFLEIAEKDKLSIRDLNREIKRYVADHENRFRLANEPKKYHVIYADPPWPVGSIVMDKWESPLDEKYPTMTIQDIVSLPVANMAAEDSSLFLWTTHTFLHEAFHIIDRWGFKYFCIITWDKGNGWTQNGFHKKTELLLYGYKGKMNIDQYGEAIPTLISEAKGEHSKKPDSIRNMISNKIIGNKIELFARQRFDGWDSWGNEV